MYKNILVPIDLNQSDQSKTSLGHAAELAKSSGANLHLVTVLPEIPNLVAVHMSASYPDDARSSAANELKKLASDHGLGDGDCSTTVRHGPIYQKILDTAETVGADMIVIASHKPEAADYLLGSVAAKVVRHAKSSVLVLR